MMYRSGIVFVGASVLMGCGNSDEKDMTTFDQYGGHNNRPDNYNDFDFFGSTKKPLDSFVTVQTDSPYTWSSLSSIDDISTTATSTTTTTPGPGVKHIDLPVEVAPIITGERCRVDGSFHERLYVNGEGDVPAVIRVEVLSKTEIDRIPANTVGRWIDGRDGWMSSSFADRLAEVMELTSPGSTNFLHLWHASRGPKFLEHVQQRGPVIDSNARCGAVSRRNHQNEKNCFTFMMLVTNIPVPPTMKPRHVAKALGLDAFCVANQAGLVAELTAYNNDVSRMIIDNWNTQRRRYSLSYSNGFAANWLAFCPNLIDAVTPEIRKMVFNHGMYRHRIMSASRASHAYNINVRIRNHTLTEMMPMLLEPIAHRLLRRVDSVHFNDEAGYGPGLITNWYEEMGRQIVGSDFGIFQISDNKKYAELKPKVLSDARRVGNEAEMKRRLKAAGRFLGHVIANKRYFATDLTTMFLAKLTGRILGFEALKFYEQNAFFGYEMVYHDANCGIDVPEYLDPAGDAVWPENQNARVWMLDKLISEYVTKESQEEYAELSSGLFEVIPRSVFESGIKIKELHEVFFGASIVDLDDMFRNWDVSNFLRGENHEQIRMLKEVLRAWSRDAVNGQMLLRKFVEFVTGSSRVVAGGFGAYRGATGYHFTVISRSGVDDWPRSHNCWNRIDMPRYTSQATMDRKLREAILNSDAFGIL